MPAAPASARAAVSSVLLPCRGRPEVGRSSHRRLRLLPLPALHCMREPPPSAAAHPTMWAMAASPAKSFSSCSSIEVSSAASAYCDTATSGGGSQPAAESIKSTLTRQETVRALCRKFSIPADYKPACAGDDGRACRAPPRLKGGAICVYEDALDAGMRVPLHPFYAKLLRHYALAPSQLTPNAWRYVAAFVALCSDAGVKPRLSVFRHFFTVCIYKNHGREGWHFFKPHKASEPDRRCRLFSTTIWHLPKNDGWKERFFFLSSPMATWPCPVRWGKPSEEAAGDPKLSNKAKEDIQKLYHVQGSTPIDLMSLLAEHKLAAALVPSTPVKMEEHAGATAARAGPSAPNWNSPDVQSPPTPPGGSIARDELWASVVQADGDDWLQTVLTKTADVVKKESWLLRQQLREAREAEAAARAELADARKSEAAAKAEAAELSKARKSEAAAKAELSRARRSEAAAKAELGKARKSEAAAKAELGKVRRSEAAAKAQLSKAIKSEAAAKAELAAVKAEFDKARESETASKAELEEMRKSLDDAEAKIKKSANDYCEDFMRLHSLMVDSFGSAFGKVCKMMHPQSSTSS